MDKKSRAAFFSVFAALFLTLSKGIVGFLTGSLGILSEALHSLLDLFATLITFFSVKASAKPPDEKHLFGHQKIENLSALFQTLLLYFTCFWIIYEVIERLFFKKAEITVNIWSYLVVILSITVDFSRSRVLYKTAKETKSPALEADALHFSSDIGSSLVVLVGLISTKLGFEMADSLSALAVAIIVLIISTELAIRSINSLLDTVPKGAKKKVELSAKSVEGVQDVYDVKVREASDTTFVEMNISVDKNLPFSEVHRITSEVENATMSNFIKSKVIVHPEPVLSKDGIYEFALSLAESFGAKLHDFTILSVQDGQEISLHLEWDKNMKFNEAWKYSEKIKEGIKENYESVKDVHFHFEPNFEKVGKYTLKSSSSLEKEVEDTIKNLSPPLNLATVRVIFSETITHIYLSFPVDSNLTIDKVHDLSSKLEKEIYKISSDHTHIIALAYPKK